MLQMLDGNEHAACEAVGQGFKSLLQYQLPVGARRYADSKPVTQGAVPCTGAKQQSARYGVKNRGGLFAFQAQLLLKTVVPKPNRLSAVADNPCAIVTA